jgi:hypothetical protein
MQNTLPAPVRTSINIPILALLLVTLIGLVTYFTYNPAPQPPKDRLNMEKSSGKNGKHSNPKARQSAEEEYQKIKQEYNEWDKKPKKNSGRQRIY